MDFVGQIVGPTTVGVDIAEMLAQRTRQQPTGDREMLVVRARQSPAVRFRRGGRYVNARPRLRSVLGELSGEGARGHRAWGVRLSNPRPRHYDLFQASRQTRICVSGKPMAEFAAPTDQL